VNRRSWRLVPLSDIPSGEGLGSEDPAVEQARTQAERGGHPTFAGYPTPSPTWHAIRSSLGITAFGVAATEAAAGESLIWPHTEAHYGHEELYVVLEGHELLFVKPKVGRGELALETPTRLLIVGGKPGTHEPPVWAPDWRPRARLQ
jgi:hypothetical protein